MYQLSKKLTGLVSPEEKKRLNPQDLKDLKEIQGLIEIADIREKSAKRKLESRETLEPASNEIHRKNFFEQKPYLECDRDD